MRIVRQLVEPVFPKKYFYKLWSLYFILKRPRKSYSYVGEDLIIEEYFNHIDLKNGRYLDIGCYHPTHLSNTHLLHVAGWDGFAVDLDQHKLDSMQFWRKNIKCKWGAIVPHAEINEKSVVYKFSKSSYSSIDTLHKKTADSHKSFAGDYVEEEVELIDINQYFSTLPSINFLNIDVEGLDEEILLSLNLDLYHPNLILFESLNDFGGSSEVVDKLTKFGYQHLFTSGVSVCYFFKSWSALLAKLTTDLVKGKALSH